MTVWFLAASFGSVLGVDVSESMVQFATQTYGSERVRFQVVDIGSATAAGQIGSTFHRLVSLFCLHWVQNQTYVFTHWVQNQMYVLCIHSLLHIHPFDWRDDN